MAGPSKLMKCSDLHQGPKSGGPSYKHPSMTVSKSVSIHCGGSLAKMYTLFFGSADVTAKRIGSTLLLEAYEYIIREFRADRCWGGVLTAGELRVTHEGEFFISTEANESATTKKLMENLKDVTTEMLVHFTLDGKVAIYVRHLEKCFLNPPAFIYESKEALDRFLDFLVHHPGFARFMPRIDLTKGIGMVFKYSTGVDVKLMEACVTAAAAANHPHFSDWREVVHVTPVLNDVLWHDKSEYAREQKKFRCKATAKDEFIQCRNSLEHGPQKTIVAVLPTNQTHQPHQSVSGQCQHVAAMNRNISVGTNISSSPQAVVRDIPRNQTHQPHQSVSGQDQHVAAVNRNISVGTNISSSPSYTVVRDILRNQTSQVLQAFPNRIAAGQVRDIPSPRYRTPRVLQAFPNRILAGHGTVHNIPRYPNQILAHQAIVPTTPRHQQTSQASQAFPTKMPANQEATPSTSVNTSQSAPTGTDQSSQQSAKMSIPN